MGGPGPSLWVRRAERVQPPGTGGRTGGEASCVSSLGGWRDGGRSGWEGTAPLQPVRSSQDAGPHPARCAASPGTSWGASEQFAGEVRLCSQVVCGQPRGLPLPLLPVGQLPPRGPSALCWGSCTHTAQSCDNCTSVTTEQG